MTFLSVFLRYVRSHIRRSAEHEPMHLLAVTSNPLSLDQSTRRSYEDRAARVGNVGSTILPKQFPQRRMALTAEAEDQAVQMLQEHLPKALAPFGGTRVR